MERERPLLMIYIHRTAESQLERNPLLQRRALFDVSIGGACVGA
jgi:hypothetical protein